MKTDDPVMRLDNNGHIVGADTEGAISIIEKNRLQRELGELEIKLGTARLEGDTERVLDLKVAIAELREKMTPSLRIIETPYPTPLAEEAFYGLAGDIVRAFEPHSEADPAALLGSFLTAYGNVIGGGSWFTVGVIKHFPLLFILCIGDTSKARKGTSWGPIRVLFESVEPEWVDDRIQNGMSSGEGIINAVRDPIFKEGTLVVEGVSDKRLLVVESEFAQPLNTLRREGNILSPVIRNSWDSDKLQTLTKISPTKATDPKISIIGHITAQELIAGLNEIQSGNGFANRFLMFCVKRSKSLPFPGGYDSIDIGSLTAKLKKAVEFGKLAGEIRWAEKTKPLWAKIYPDLSEGKPGIIGAITARAEAQVVRLVCIYALLDCSNEIEPEHLKAALAVWSYAEASVRYIFQGRALDPLAKKIREALASRPQGLTRTEINNLLGGHYNKNRIDEALNTLKALGQAASKTIETGGRPVEMWFLINSGAEKAEKADKAYSE
ncbi:MAG: hypothetical protein ACHQ6U_11160 [Thermodesulfobacteriota bacterium]